MKGQHIWHVFSCNLIPCDGLLTGDDARRAFDEMDKGHCICCDLYNGGGVSDRLLPHLTTAREVEDLCEFYVVAGDYSWTYIKTHEGDLCGPYFVKRGNDYGKR